MSSFAGVNVGRQFTIFGATGALTFSAPSGLLLLWLLPRTAARWTMGGTSRGEFRGLPATGKTFVMTGMTIDKWEGERIVEEWTNYDLLGGLQQLGIIPEMARQETTG